MKKLIIILAVAGALAAGWYWGVPLYQERATTHVIPSDWKTYTNADIGFTMRYGPEMTLVERSKEDISFYTWGPTQSEGTEVYDGMILSFRKVRLDENMTPEEHINRQMELFKEVGEITQPLHDVKINGISAKSFGASSLGDFTILFVTLDGGAIIEIGYLAPDPGNLGFQDKIDKALSTFVLMKK